MTRRQSEMVGESRRDPFTIRPSKPKKACLLTEPAVAYRYARVYGEIVTGFSSQFQFQRIAMIVNLGSSIGAIL